MKNLITIDGGTTNTRVSLVKGDDIICTKRIAMGAGDCIQSADKLKSEIKLAIEAILDENSLVFGNIEAVVASGMITSEYGLYTLPHIVAPVGIKQLHDGMKKVMLEDICPLPFFFIPGVKMLGELCDTDMMRGEETELMGIMQSGGEAYVLPGSHSKLIFTDSYRRITRFKTMLTGEMLASLSKNTILRDAVDITYGEPDSEYLLKGYGYCRENGINEALFKTRILKNLFKCNMNQTLGFFMGAVLQGEIDSLTKSGVESVIIGGRSNIKNAMCHIMNTLGIVKAISLDDDASGKAVPLGAVRIYNYTE